MRSCFQIAHQRKKLILNDEEHDQTLQQMSLAIGVSVSRELMLRRSGKRRRHYILSMDVDYTTRHHLRLALGRYVSHDEWRLARQHARFPVPG
jgi:hypothetical protein